MGAVRRALASRLSPRSKYLLIGLSSFAPGWRARHPHGTGEVRNARYSYSVWLRHLVHAQRAGLTEVPRVVAELGPGTSLGVGLAALLSGAERYYGLDLAPDARFEAEIPVLDELCELLRARARIPDEQEYPEVLPRLKSYEFPRELLTDETLDRALAPDRIARLRAELADPAGASAPDRAIHYAAPWFEAGRVPPDSIDLLLSQAVFEHVDDLPTTLAALRELLRPGGLMSHQIDYRSHGVASEWNGHWTYGDTTWRIIRGHHLNLINRLSHSEQRKQLLAAGLEVVTDLRFHAPSNLRREQLAPRFRGFSDEDLETASGFLQARRPLQVGAPLSARPGR